MRKVALALLLAAVVWTGVRWGTFVAGGSDSYCYAAQVERWLTLLRQGFGGQAFEAVEPLALEAPWPNAPATFTPTGFAPSQTEPGAIVPVCPSGLSLAMVPFFVIGGRDAIFLVVPLFGALLVGATYVLGSRYGARVGFGAALLTAASPIVLYQLVQPMSDVPAAALWVAAVAAATGTKSRGPLLAGLAAAGAILVRPNLVPMGIPIGLFLLLRPERIWRERLRAAVTYAVGAAAGCVAVALIQQSLYGSPFSSGYGSLPLLFGLDHIAPNARLYSSWMTETHTVAWLLALAAPFLLPGAFTTLLVAVAAVNIASYLPYVVFDVWWYLRFMLPAIPLVLVLAVASFDAIWRRVRLPGEPQGFALRSPAIAVTVFAVALSAVFVSTARDRSAFRLHLLEARFKRGGVYVADHLPANALIMTSWQSGSVRFYSGRRTLDWGALDGAWLDRALAFAREKGLEPYLLFEGGEEQRFRERFGAGSALAKLDWPPMAEVAGEVKIYRPDDRDRYWRGENVRTEFVP